MAPLRQSNINSFLIPSSLPPAARAARSASSATTRAPAAEAPDVGKSSATAAVGKPPKTEAKAAVKAKAATKAKADVKGKAKDKGKGKEKGEAPPKKRRKVAEDEGTVEEGERAEEGAAGEPTAWKLLDFEPIGPVRPLAATLPWPTTVGQPAFDAADMDMEW